MDNRNIEEFFLKVQKPGRYAGGELGSVFKDTYKTRFAFCFPDTYEIGMSHLGMKILYSALNNDKDIWCERCFAPADDFEQVLRENNIPLFALESRDSLACFDIIGFSLMYELCYTTVLNMLDLAGIPFKSCERTEYSPLVVAGGPCACNPEPMADFIDLFMIGEGEEVILEVTRLYEKYKSCGDKKAFLIEASKIDGVYVPSLYDVEYKSDGTINSITPKYGAPLPVRRRIIKDLDTSHYPENFVLPFSEIVHDRAVEEIFRGCIRGCRFCQAGFIYRPVREKAPDTIIKQSETLCSNTGYEEMSLLSLSTSDYSEINDLLPKLVKFTDEKKLSLSLPSLRIDNFSDELLEEIKLMRKTGLTFAPEAGTQRLRDAINKNITEEDIFSACKRAFLGGYTNVKLYFMLGLPTETDEDIIGIAKLAEKIVDLFYSLPNRPRGKAPQITISVACFIPKPFTPFEFAAQNDEETLKRKQRLLLNSVTSKKVKVNYHDSTTSLLEAVFAKGDRRLSSVIEYAFKHGAKMDSWSEHFDINIWLNAFIKNNLDMDFYALRERSFDEVFPWDHIDIGVNKSFFVNEYNKALHNDTTPNCKEKCSGCGAARYGCGICERKRGE